MKVIPISLWRVALSSTLLLGAFACFGRDDLGGSEKVGRAADGSVILPMNQVLTPAGQQVDLPGLRPQVLALSPDRKLLVTAGKTHDLVLIDPADGHVIDSIALPPDGLGEEQPGVVSTHILKPDKDDQVSFTGLVFSPDGSRIYLANVQGSIKVFAVDAQHGVKALRTYSLPPAGAPRRKEEIPAGLAVSKDGSRLYVTGNLSNRLLELDVVSGKTLRTFEVGALPYEVVLAGRKAYVSNWGGRRPESGSLTGPSGQGTQVRVDPVRHIASEGSVSVIDLDSGRTTREIMVGLHSSAMVLTPDSRHLIVANASSDSLSVIDTAKDAVIDTISLRWHPNDLFGASPNALAIDPHGRTLYVCNGTQNAVAVVDFKPGKSVLQGLIPTGWFPGAIVQDAESKRLFVANIKGEVPVKKSTSRRKGYNSHQYSGTVSLIPIPDQKELARDTELVRRNFRAAVLEQAFEPMRLEAKPRPVPERIGEPSVFHHVVYIIKENRTYDQVLGDVKEGNGDASLCIFGEKETPNQHKLVRDFTLLDNTYCSGILSADGHQWATTAFATDYMEKSFAGFPRSYPDGMEENDRDAMAYSPVGFIWDNVLSHGKTLRDYGEFTMGSTSWKDSQRKKSPKFLDFYQDFTHGTGLLNIGCVPAVASLGPYIMTNTIGWDMAVPDVFRAAQFITELHQYEAAGKLPDFIVICLPNDHTSGTSEGAPTPAAQVADNDLAFGRIVEAISHSKFWKDTCIFAIEDDPQAGWDHVSGYRTTAYLASPYTRRHAVVSRNYNQTSLIRTMELILGLPPMNQMDGSATPMFDCFTPEPDFTPFDSLTNNVPLDQMNPRKQAIADPITLRYAQASERLRLDQPDQCPEDVLNHILWHAQKGRRAAYPSWAITVKDAD